MSNKAEKKAKQEAKIAKAVAKALAAAGVGAEAVEVKETSSESLSVGAKSGI